VLEVGDDPDGWAPPVSVRRGRARGLARSAEKLPGWAGMAVRGKGGEGREAGWLGPQGRKERGKREKETRPGPMRKIGRKRIAFKCN
jgi:hypothetical protein